MNLIQANAVDLTYNMQIMRVKLSNFVIIIHNQGF